MARFSFQSRSLLGRLCAHIRVHDPRILETSIFFLADYVLHARSVSVSARQKAAKSEERVWPFFSLFFISFFFSLDASRCVMPLRHIKPRGEDKKREKKATDRWRPGGWHSNVPPCLRRSTKDAGASEGNWKMTRRERERHGDESKGVDVGNQPVVEEEGGGGCSKRPRERERGGVVACAREKGSRGRRWRRKRERERWAAARWQNGEGKDEGKRGAVEQEGYA